MAIQPGGNISMYIYICIYICIYIQYIYNKIQDVYIYIYIWIQLWQKGWEKHANNNHSSQQPDSSSSSHHATSPALLAVCDVLLLVKPCLANSEVILGWFPLLMRHATLSYVLLNFALMGHATHPSVTQYVFMWCWCSSLQNPDPKRFLEELEALLWPKDG